jgi:hypothetical protein
MGQGNVTVAAGWFDDPSGAHAISIATSWRIAAFGLIPLTALAAAVAVCGRRIARDVLAIHEREIAARWLDREV